MLKYLVPASLIIVGAIHVIPLSGVLGVGRLNSLYGINITDPDLSILMRHRAVLFGLLGLFCIYAAIKPPLYFIALTAGAVSVGSFLYLAYATGGYNEELRRVIVADLVAAVFLVIGFAGYFISKSGNGV
ncbi:MAG: phosphopantetheine adenylyltransferase [Woeseia sp.]|nr:phosphopantetheine adenylyltransferase [Woeseia sp.]